jgi:hypothetical protein
MEGVVKKPKPCKHRTKVEIEDNKMVKVMAVGNFQNYV